MSRERILDLGIGSGGDYLFDDFWSGKQVIGSDIRANLCRRVKSAFEAESLEVVQASGSHLPFAANSFDVIRMVLPERGLAVPGLTPNHFLLKASSKYKQWYPQGFYPEWHRVLKPGGKLDIWGDVWVQPDKVVQTAQGYFTELSRLKLSLVKFKQLGTLTAVLMAERNAKKVVKQTGEPWADYLVHLVLKVKK